MALYRSVFNRNGFEVGAVTESGEVFGIAPDSDEFDVHGNERVPCMMCGKPDLEFNGPDHRICEVEIREFFRCDPTPLEDFIF